MSKYNDTLLTTAGQTLATRAANGSAKFSITRAVGSKSDLSGKTDAELAALTALPEETQVAQIVAELDDPDGSVGVTGTQVTFQNKNESVTIDEGYYLNTIGLYAKEDGSDKEILYALTTADEADYIPDYADNVFYKFTITIYVVVGQKANVSVAIDVTGTASIDYVDNAIAKAMNNLPTDIARTGADNKFTGTNDFQKATVKGVNVATTADITNAVNSATANMADYSKPTNFTAGLQSGGFDVATAADLKSVEASAWRQLDNKYIIPASKYTLAPSTTILYKIDDSIHTLYLSGSIVLTDIDGDSVLVTVQLGSIINSILTSSVSYLGAVGSNSNQWQIANADKSSTNLKFYTMHGVLSIAAVAERGSRLAYVTYDELV